MGSDLSGSDDVRLRLYGPSAEQGRPVRNASGWGKGGRLDKSESANPPSKSMIGKMMLQDLFSEYHKAWSPLLVLETWFATMNTKRFLANETQEFTHVSYNLGALATEG